MTLSTLPYKGSRDFFPEDKRFQKQLFKTWRKVVEKYGYVEYDAPIIEPLELFLAKSSAEIVNEQTYAFEDRGGRSVIIRPEMTPSVSRMVASKRQELAYPLRWYSIPNLWRYERPQRGRLREHWQLNVDIFGVFNLSAELEMIQISTDLLKAFGAKSEMYKIRLNNRQLVNFIFSDHFGLDSTQTISLTRLIDHKSKMDHEHFVSQIDMILSPSQRDGGLTNQIVDILKVKDLKDLPKDISDHQSVSKIKELIELLDISGIKNYEFDITLMRGFDYYTDIVFEIYDNHPENNRSMFGGGRYDGLVGMFNVDPIPTVGFGVGDVTFQNFLEIHELMPITKSSVDVVAILIGDVFKQSIGIIDEIRNLGVNIAVDSSGAKIDKQIKMADKSGVRYVLFIGEEELKSKSFKLKDLKTGQEELHGIDRIISIVKDKRN